jgi:multiple sugar transport system permease protein
MARDAVPPLRAAFSHLLLWGLGISMLLPFGWMVLTSFKSDAEVFQPHLLPQATTLGADGAPVRSIDSRPLFTAPLVLNAAGLPESVDGQPVFGPGEPLTIRRGDPVLAGSKGDRAVSAAGEPLSDDEGMPVVNGMVADNADDLAADGGWARLRDPRLLPRFAEPVLIPRDRQPAGNEALARAYFSRFSATWDVMIAGRWQGRVPLMASRALKDAWAGQGGKAEAMRLDGQPVLDPGSRDGALPYLWRDCYWEDEGKPVRFQRRANLLTDGRGLPIRYQSAFPVLRTPDDPLLDAAGTPLLVRVGSATAAPITILGRDVATDTSVRLVTSNYQTVLSDPSIKMSLFAWNSLFVCICTVMLQILTSSLAAFAFARLEWPGRDKVFICYLGTLMVPGVVTAIPNYLILQQLGWLNTFYALIIPGAATAYGTFMLRQYMLTLPKGLEEAARIDGASLLRVWWDIAVPLSKPALITLAIFTFAGTWQSFAWPLIVCPDESVRMLPVAVQRFSTAQSSAYNLLMAASILMMIPTLLLYIFGQKYFVRGIQLGGVKG